MGQQARLRHCCRFAAAGRERALAKFGGTRQIAKPRNRASSQGRGGGGTMAGAAAKTGGLRLFKLMEIDEIDETEQVPWLSLWE